MHPSPLQLSHFGKAHAPNISPVTRIASRMGVAIMQSLYEEHKLEPGNKAIEIGLFMIRRQRRIYIILQTSPTLKSISFTIPFFDNFIFHRWPLPRPTSEKTCLAAISYSEMSDSL